MNSWPLGAWAAGAWADGAWPLPPEEEDDDVVIWAIPRKPEVKPSRRIKTKQQRQNEQILMLLLQ